jgi:hypothetical protein
MFKTSPSSWPILQSTIRNLKCEGSTTPAFQQAMRLLQSRCSFAMTVWHKLSLKEGKPVTCNPQHVIRNPKSKIQNVKGVFENEDRNEAVFGPVCERERRL